MTSSPSPNKRSHTPDARPETPSKRREVEQENAEQYQTDPEIFEEMPEASVSPYQNIPSRRQPPGQTYQEPANEEISGAHVSPYQNMPGRGYPGATSSRRHKHPHPIDDEMAGTQGHPQTPSTSRETEQENRLPGQYQTDPEFLEEMAETSVSPYQNIPSRRQPPGQTYQEPIDEEMTGAQVSPHQNMPSRRQPAAPSSRRRKPPQSIDDEIAGADARPEIPSTSREAEQENRVPGQYENDPEISEEMPQSSVSPYQNIPGRRQPPGQTYQEPIDEEMSGTRISPYQNMPGRRHPGTPSSRRRKPPQSIDDEIAGTEVSPYQNIPGTQSSHYPSDRGQPDYPVDKAMTRTKAAPYKQDNEPMEQSEQQENYPSNSFEEPERFSPQRYQQEPRRRYPGDPSPRSGPLQPDYPLDQSLSSEPLEYQNIPSKQSSQPQPSHGRQKPEDEATMPGETTQDYQNAPKRPHASQRQPRQLNQPDDAPEYVDDQQEYDDDDDQLVPTRPEAHQRKPHHYGSPKSDSEQDSESDQLVPSRPEAGQRRYPQPGQLGDMSKLDMESPKNRHKPAPPSASQRKPKHPYEAEPSDDMYSHDAHREPRARQRKKQPFGLAGGDDISGDDSDEQRLSQPSSRQQGSPASCEGHEHVLPGEDDQHFPLIPQAGKRRPKAGKRRPKPSERKPHQLGYPSRSDDDFDSAASDSEDDDSSDEYTPEYSRPQPSQRKPRVTGDPVQSDEEMQLEEESPDYQNIPGRPEASRRLRPKPPESVSEVPGYNVPTSPEDVEFEPVITEYMVPEAPVLFYESEPSRRKPKDKQYPPDSIHKVEALEFDVPAVTSGVDTSAPGTDPGEFKHDSPYIDEAAAFQPSAARRRPPSHPPTAQPRRNISEEDYHPSSAPEHQKTTQSPAGRQPYRPNPAGRSSKSPESMDEDIDVTPAGHELHQADPDYVQPEGFEHSVPIPAMRGKRCTPGSEQGNYGQADVQHTDTDEQEMLQNKRALALKVGN